MPSCPNPPATPSPMSPQAVRAEIQRTENTKRAGAGGGEGQGTTRRGQSLGWCRGGYNSFHQVPVSQPFTPLQEPHRSSPPREAASSHEKRQRASLTAPCSPRTTGSCKPQARRAGLIPSLVLQGFPPRASAPPAGKRSPLTRPRLPAPRAAITGPRPCQGLSWDRGRAGRAAAGPSRTSRPTGPAPAAPPGPAASARRG